jgi:predicted dehydrogenase
MADKKYQVGVIGYGLSAKIFQIPFILASKDFELGAIVQRSGNSAAQDHPEVKIYRAPDDLFNDETIDVVVVSTPPSTHFTLASAALNAGKHGKLLKDQNTAGTRLTNHPR